MLANRAQYIFVMIFAFLLFLSISLVLLPLAYLKSAFIKLNSLKSQMPFHKKLEEILVFFPFGLLILAVGLVMDSVYFWVFLF